MDIPIHQDNLAPNLVGRFNGRQEFRTRLLTLVDAQFPLFGRKKGLHEHHRRLPFLDHFQESFFVEASVANQSIVATLAQLNRHDVRLVFFDLLTNGFHRCCGHMGGPDKPEVFVDVNDRRGRHRGTSSTEER